MAGELMRRPLSTHCRRSEYFVTPGSAADYFARV
jgi:hypothetical protein